MSLFLTGRHQNLIYGAFGSHTGRIKRKLLVYIVGGAWNRCLTLQSAFRGLIFILLNFGWLLTHYHVGFVGVHLRVCVSLLHSLHFEALLGDGGVVSRSAAYHSLLPRKCILLNWRLFGQAHKRVLLLICFCSACHWSFFHVVKQIAAVIVEGTSRNEGVLGHKGDFFGCNRTHTAVHLAFGAGRDLQTTLRVWHGDGWSALAAKVVIRTGSFLLLISVKGFELGRNSQFGCAVYTLLESYFFVLFESGSLVFPVHGEIDHANQFLAFVTHREQLNIAEDKVVAFFFLLTCRVWKVPAKILFRRAGCVFESATFAGWSGGGCSKDSAPYAIKFHWEHFVSEVSNPWLLVDAADRTGCSLGVVAGDDQTQVDVGRNL